MKMRRILLAALSICTFVVGALLHRDQAVDERAVLREMMPDRLFGEKTGAPPRYPSDGDAVAFNSYDIAPSVRGYAGPIKLLLVLGKKGTIRGIRIIEHRETKNYVHYLETPEYLNRFIGKSIQDRFEIGRDLDGITRATVSVEALARTVRESTRIVAMDVYGITVSGDDAPGKGSSGWIWYLLVFAAAVGGYIATRRTKTLLRLRDMSLLAGILVVGLLLSSPFSVLHVFNFALFGPSSSALWWAIILTMAVSLAFAGRLYCGWICPFGALSELIGRLPARKWTIAREQDEARRRWKYVLLGGLVILVFITRRPEYANIETYVTLFSFHGNAMTWMLVAFALFANVRVERFWCRYLCPVAALTGLLARAEKGYPSRNDCPMGNRQDPAIAECIRCNRCYAPQRDGNSSFKANKKEG